MVVCLEREILELELSVLINRMKFDSDVDMVGIRNQIRDIDCQTNLARRNRCTYDYILSLFENT